MGGAALARRRAALFFGAAFADPLLLRIVCALALGPSIALLFRIAHDAGHECHFSNRRLNRIVGRLSNLAPYHAYSLWLHGHNGRHHTFTNLRDRDYIWIPLSKAEYDGLSPIGRAIARVHRTTLGVGVYYLCAIWWGKMLFPRRPFVHRIKRVHVTDSAVVIAFFCMQLAVLSIGAADAAAFVGRVLLAIVVPFLIFNWLVGFVSFLNHTHPTVPWFARREEWSFYIGQVHCTVHMGVPRWFVFFITDLGLHGAHHIDPRVPIWSLSGAEAQIRADAGGEIVAERWTWRRHREIMRCCKLYDYDAHRWLDFQGRATTAALVPPKP